MNTYLNEDLARLRRQDLLAEAQRYRRRAAARQDRSVRSSRLPRLRRLRPAVMTPAATPHP
jgi:hypothetical protein